MTIFEALVYIVVTMIIIMQVLYIAGCILENKIMKYEHATHEGISANTQKYLDQLERHIDE